MQLKRCDHACPLNCGMEGDKRGLSRGCRSGSPVWGDNPEEKITRAKRMHLFQSKYKKLLDISECQVGSCSSPVFEHCKDDHEIDIIRMTRGTEDIPQESISSERKCTRIDGAFGDWKKHSGSLISGCPNRQFIRHTKCLTVFFQYTTLNP